MANVGGKEVPLSLLCSLCSGKLAKLWKGHLSIWARFSYLLVLDGLSRWKCGEPSVRFSFSVERVLSVTKEKEMAPQIS